MTYLSSKSMKKQLSKEWTEMKKQERKHPFRVWFGLAGWVFVAFLAVQYSSGTIASPRNHVVAKHTAHKAQVVKRTTSHKATPVGFDHAYPQSHR